MKLGRGHRALKLWSFDNPAKESVGVKQHRIVKKDVIDADHLFVTQHDVGSLRVSFVHRQTDPKMRVVIKVGARRNNPIDEARLNQRNQRRDAQARRCERAGECHANRDVRLEHLLREELTRFTQAGCVVGDEGVIN